jgi:hypothetical protein
MRMVQMSRLYHQSRVATLTDDSLNVILRQVLVRSEPRRAATSGRNEPYRYSDEMSLLNYGFIESEGAMKMFRLHFNGGNYVFAINFDACCSWRRRLFSTSS